MTDTSAIDKLADNFVEDPHQEKKPAKTNSPPQFVIKKRNDQINVTPVVQALYKKVKKAIKKHSTTPGKIPRARLEKLIANNIEKLEDMGFSCSIVED